ncbi:uncharacterized protein LOC135535773 [Oncorhynchus masou masou]|uniref:uncharacterized protein LOC135535773 n=1 Tax=Oncorhynchus masou masou TaxID=90313 RepID=UPI0031835332
MASTRQSALEYITNGRLRLIGRLQNLPLILENLFQRKVLHEEEVSKIQAEVDHFDQTRKILDWVSAKGEAACYELLMILDMTRKRTLDDADLQQWISCFPFKDDPEMTDYFVGSKPCHGYQTQLKCKARKITEGAWKHSCSLLPDRCRNGGTFSYTPLVLDTDEHSSDSKIKVKSKICKKARRKKLKSFIPLAKQETSPADLLKTHEKILLVGKPGIGKTSVSHQMLNLWAEKDHRELDYMFYFEARDISHRKPMSLEDLLFNMYSEPNESKEEILQDIKKNSENVVIIFDGITDLSSLSVVKDLVENLLPDAKIVTTCRPDQSEDFLTDWPTDWFRVEVKGFSDESIRAYLTQMLSAELDSLSSVLNNLELFSLCHVPMYALMVVACSYYSTLADSKQPCSTTKMYINILRHCIQKHSGKRLEDHNKCLIQNREKILSLAEIAFDATNEKNMNLTTLSCEEGSVHFAFLGAFMVKVEPTASDTCSAFLHYTMQEFFGALWLLQNPDKIREVLEKCPTEEWKHTKHLIPFLCGLLNERNTRLVNSLVPAEQIKKTSDWFFKEVVNTFLPSQTNQDHVEGGAPESEKDLLFLCQCLYEYQSTEACLLLLDKLDYHLDLSEEHLDPHQCCAVSYVTSQSAERKVGLDLNGCTVSDQGVRLILGSLKNVRHLGPSSDDSSDPSMLYQLWTTLLSSETEMDFTSLLGICGKELHLPVQGERRVFERAEEVMTQSLERVNLCLHWDQRTVLSKALSKTILKCLPHINKLSFTPPQGQRRSPEERTKRERTFLLNMCLQAALHERGTIQTAVEKVLSLSEVYHNQKCDFLLDLYSHVKDYETQTGRMVLPALQPVYQSAPAVWSIDLSERKASLLLEVLKLQPEKKPVELKGWSDEESEVRSFLQCLPYITQLRLNVGVAVKLSRLVRRIERGATPLIVPEFSLVLKSSQTPEIVLSRALSNVVSLLRLWRVQCLDLTDLWIQGHSLITLLCHQGPLSLRLNSDTLQQLTVVVYEAQDKELTQWFLEKVGGDLTSCRLDWEVLLSLLQHSTHNITVDLKKNRLLEKSISDLLPFLGRVTLKRSSSSFVKSTIRQIYDRASECVSSLLSSSDHWINLNSRELDRVDCTALCFTLQHSHQVKVNLLWTSIPSGEIESILPLLDRVSQLSVDRRLLLSFLQCCASSQIQQGAPSSPPTAVWLLRSLHYRLDFSCSSSVDLSVQDQEKALCLTTDHCMAINSVLKQNQHSTQLVQNQVQLILRDCEVKDRALRELLPILHIVKLSPSKALLLQLLDLVCEGIEEGLLRHAESLCRALDGELDLSETRLDQKACGSLALVLEHSEGLSELDLSHCQLTDHQLQPLITHLHKVQVLDLSHNVITDALTDRILQLVSTNTSIHTIRLFNNRIQDRRPFLTDKRFDIW